MIKKVLPTGLRVLFIPLKDNPTVTVTVLVGTGSDYEKVEQTGISHFLEHMCFKGTTKRPSASAIARELDSLGAHYNAFTDHEITGYYAKVESKHSLVALDIVSDIYLNSTFPQTEIDKERGVIIEEINMYEDMPNHMVQNIFTRLMYNGQSAGRDVIGTAKSVGKMNHDDFVNYHKKFYTPGNTVIVVSGSFDQTIMLSAVKKQFVCLNKVPVPKTIKTKDAQKQPQVNVVYKQTDQSHMVLGWHGVPIGHSDQQIYTVLASLLGGGMSSRLFTKLREDMGVCYYVNAGNEHATTYGYFAITAGVTNTRIEEVLRVLFEECKKLKTELVTDEELKRVKQYLIGTMKLALESSDSLAMFYGPQEVLKGSTLSPEDRAKKVNAVTKADLIRVAKKLFKIEKTNLAIIGPWKDSVSVTSILSASGVL